MPLRKGSSREGMSAGLAFDKQSVRSVDKDGRMRVALTNISKANVCDYFGHEIPDYKALGLDPDKMYKLLRAPEELSKAAETFDGVQLLVKHIPVSANDHQPDSIVGTTGTDTQYNDPYLQTQLIVWAKEGIDLIESEEQKELSAGYHYRADMRPGTFKGQPYDGVMRDIVGNHVALVKEGRAGSDVVVGDSAPPKPSKLKEFLTMKTKTKVAPLSRKAAVLKGALLVSVPSLLAADAKAKLDTGMFDGVLAGITSKNFKAKAPELKLALDALVKPHLATDADMTQLAELVDAFCEGEEMEGRDIEPNSAIPLKAKEKAEEKEDGEDAEPEPWEKMRERMKEKGMDEKDIAACDAEMGYEPAPEGCDESPEDKEAREKRNKEGEDSRKTARDARRAAKDAAMKGKDTMKGKDADKPVTAAGMDAALKRHGDTVRAQVIADQKALREAENFVRPYVGDLAMAHDSAEAVYRTTLSTLKPDLDLAGVDPSAFKSMIGLIEKPKKASASEPIAMDSAALNSFESLFPDTKRFRK